MQNSKTKLAVIPLLSKKVVFHLITIDLLFPSNPSFETALSTSLKIPQYAKGKTSLYKIVTEGVNFIGKYSTRSGISFLSAGSGPKFSHKEEDVWCIDYRGVLTLSVCKDTYNGFGLVGKRVAFGKGKSKQGDGRHVISIPLYAKDAESVKIRTQREAALKRWEERRAQEIGSPLWNILAFSESMSPEELDTALQVLVKDQVAAPFEIVSVRCQKAVLEDVHVPVVRLTPRPRPQNKLGLNQQEEEDWCETMEGLFEWVGMAGLGATRLKANDRVDPFVAVYQPPSPTRVGGVTHLRWSGFIGPSFVQSLVEFMSHHLVQSLQTDRPDFLSISSHACTWAPVSYVSLKAQTGRTDVRPPLRDPTRDVEDSWCLIATAPQHGASLDAHNAKECAWVLAESVGKHDSRLG
ncbi:ribonuclease P 40kDa subunit-domain-containing protein [Lentinula edodes]|nr:ribonuclease P 40kDa subunit-domain-containing protein [Lentinula edodes]